MILQVEQLIADRYRLKQSLGQKMGRQTWLAEDLAQENSPLVVLKMLPFTSQTHWEEVKLFEREAQVLKSLNHPRIPRYLDYLTLEETAEQLPCFVLVQSYISGRSLQEILQQDVTFREGQAHQLAREILEILIYLHELSPPVFHRDIKPSNIIWGDDRQFYLVDFGAVQDRAKAEGVTFTVVGTGGYAPPEQLWGKAVPTSDLYALSATLVHLLTGVSPAKLPQKRMRIQFRENAEGQLKGGVTIAPPFAAWLDILLDPAADRRISSARKALEALEAGFSSKTSPESTALPKGAYATLGAWTFAQYAVGILLAIVLPSFAVYVNKMVRYEAMSNIRSMNRAQQARLLEGHRLTTDLPSLGLAFEKSAKSYQYHALATPLAAYHYANPQEKNWSSYVGAVFLGSDRIIKKLNSYSIACENPSPPAAVKPEPQLVGHQIQCPEGTTPLYWSESPIFVNTDVVLAHAALRYLGVGEIEQAIQMAESIEDIDLQSVVWPEIFQQSPQTLKNRKQGQTIAYALQMAAKIPDPYLNLLVKGNIAKRVIQQGNDPLGLQLLNEAIAGSTGISDRELKTRAILYLGTIATELSNPDTARTLLQQARRETAQIAQPSAQIDLYNGIAEQLAALGDQQQAIQILDQAAIVTQEISEGQRDTAEQSVVIQGLRVIQRLQQQHYLKTGTLAPSLAALGLSEMPLDKNYRYTVIATSQGVFTQLQSIGNQNPPGISHIGAVFPVQKSVGNPSGTLSILCEKASNNGETMQRPKAFPGGTQCAADSIPIH